MKVQETNTNLKGEPKLNRLDPSGLWIPFLFDIRILAHICFMYFHSDFLIQ